MAQPFQLQVRGVFQAQPFASVPGGASQRLTSDLDILAAYSQKEVGGPSFVNATDMAPYALPFGTVTKANFFALHVITGACVAKLTTAKGADQIIPCSGGWIIIWAPTPGDEITAVNLTGTADCESTVVGT